MPHFVQLALDWCVPAPQGQKIEEKRPAAPEIQAQAAIKNEAIAALPDILTPARYAHPQANRELRLEGAAVAYRFERARRRSIGFTVGPEGLAVRAPAWVTLAAVEAALRAKSGWILRKLAKARLRQQRQVHARIAWGDGAVLPFLGQPLRVVLDARHSLLGVLQEDGAHAERQLRIGLPAAAQPAQVRDAVQAWLMRHARLHLSARLDHFAPLLGVRWTRLRLSSAQTRWGSARADGSISLNWRLLHHPQAVIDYVVVHELAHLRVMDHSPQFWNTVASVLPDHARLRRHLREEPVPDWDGVLCIE
ncbi:M48 family metallopeptidase [Comamonas granuli]|uniref:M48 family metallopeptidase n=1 Tax=Comamonas granuli TaxID=290309 RepID=UPI0005AAF867|nr:SprT family zinc-dependent metalloprotease [Comamonas granuli]